MHLDVVFFDDGIRPDDLHQLVLRHEPPVGRRERREDVERARADVDDLAVVREDPPVHIEFEAAKRDRGFFRHVYQREW